MIESNNAFCSLAAAIPRQVEEVKETDGKESWCRAQSLVRFCGDALAKMDDSKLGEMTEAHGQQIPVPEAP